MAKKFHYVNENNKYESTNNVYYTKNSKNIKVVAAFYTVNGIHRQVLSLECEHNHGTYIAGAYDPTCTEPGYTGNTYCSECNQLLAYGDTIPANGHSWSDWLNYDSDTHVRTCTVCGEFEQADHDWSNKDGVCKDCGATCEHESWTSGVCDNCGYVCTHDWDTTKWYHDPNDEAKGHFRVCKICGKGGAGESHDYDTLNRISDSQHSVVCSACNWYYIEGHEYGSWEDGGDTCIRYCECGDSETRSHNYSETSRTEPTCDYGGSVTYTCSRCGATKTDTITAPGHSYGSWEDGGDYCIRYCTNGECEHYEMADHDWKETSRTEPTCDTDGSIKYTCSRCGATKTETIPATGHDWGNDPNAGWVKYDDEYCIRTCSCGDSETAEHAWEEYSRVDSTCVEKGDITYKCSRCGATKTEYDVLPLSTTHTLEDDEWEEYDADQCIRYCTVDECTYSEKLYHNWEETSRTEPTCTGSGSVKYKCSRCNATKTDTLTATGHDWGPWNDNGDNCIRYCKTNNAHYETTTSHTWSSDPIERVEPTGCDVDGYAIYECTTCGATKTVVLSAPGHTPVQQSDGTFKCSKCGEPVEDGTFSLRDR